MKQRMKQNNIIEAFFFLIRAGLFGRTEHADSMQLDDVDWAEVYQLAKEQSVVGLVGEGIELLQDEWPRVHGSPLLPQKWAIKFHCAALKLEQFNLAMNKFIAGLIRRLDKRNIHSLLLKGQGVAQSYNKPLWRACGDVDLLLRGEDYQRAKDFLLPLASSADQEIMHKQHLQLEIYGWDVELHGSLHCGFSFHIDKELDEIYNESFYGGNVRWWTNGKAQICLLGCENDAVYVFVHFLNHFYKGGVGIKQICDWCRLLWSFRDSIDLGALESRLRSMGVMSEWRAFGMYAVEYLGMPKEAMPFYADDEKWKRKARRIHLFIMKTGSMGYNRRQESKSKSLLLKKLKSSRQRFCDLANHLMIFPLDTLRFFPSILLNGLRHK